MPREMKLITALLALVSVVGCAKKAPPPPAPPPRVAPATTQDLESLRQSYLQHYPDSQVGVIVAARSEDKLVAVGQLDVSKMAVDQVVTLIDARQNPLATGRVVRIVDQTVHVLYDAPTGPHAPAVGDLMVRF